MNMGGFMHNKSRKNDSNFKYILLIILFFVAILLCITVYSIKNNRKLTFIESAIKDTTLYIGKIIYTPFGFIKEKVIDFKELIDIKDKYEDLKKEQDKTAYYKEEILTLKKELNELKKITGIDDILSLYTYKNATVISRNYDSWYNSLTINLGSKSGIELGDAVINNGVLIGTISHVSNFTSNVKLLSTDTLDNKISVELVVNDNSIYGLLTRYDNNESVYIIEGINENIEIPNDTIVKTSGLTDKYPKGIIIGYVIDNTKDSFDLTKILKVKPATNFNEINYVSIIMGDDL